MFGFHYLNAGNMRNAVALLILRVVVGCAFVMHGWPKIQDPLNWMGEDAGVPGVFQLLAAVAEFVGGMALIAGLLTPLAALGLAVTMVVAIGMVHLAQGHPFVNPGGPSYELAAAYLAVAIAILLTGPGKLSVDAIVFGRSKSRHGK